MQQGWPERKALLACEEGKQNLSPPNRAENAQETWAQRRSSMARRNMSEPQVRVGWRDIIMESVHRQGHTKDRVPYVYATYFMCGTKSSCRGCVSSLLSLFTCTACALTGSESISDSTGYHCGHTKNSIHECSVLEGTTPTYNARRLQAQAFPELPSRASMATRPSVHTRRVSRRRGRQNYSLRRQVT